MFKEIKERHRHTNNYYLEEGNQRKIKIPQCHQDRAELIQLVEEARLVVSDIIECSCACGIQNECNFWSKYQDFLKKLE